MKISRPSPAMVVAGVALFVSLGGTSIAAVNYASRAGAVDGKSAVSASSSLSHAAGRLVATTSKGTNKGRLPGKFVAGVPKSTTFAKLIDVTDNVTGAPQTVGTLSGMGTLTSTCNDQNAAPGVEDPTSTVSFINTSGVTMNIASRIGGGNGTVGVVPDQTVSAVTINGSNTFTFHLERSGTNALIEGVVQQNNPRTAAATCAVYGVTMQILP